MLVDILVDHAIRIWIGAALVIMFPLLPLGLLRLFVRLLRFLPFLRKRLEPFAEKLHRWADRLNSAGAVGITYFGLSGFIQ